MSFNRAWEFLKAGNWYDSVDNPYGPGGVAYDGPAIDEPKPKPTMRTTRQSILPEHDPTLDETTGWEGVPPISAVRYMGDYRAGSPVSQGDYQTSFEGAPDRELGLPGIQPDVDFNAPTVDAPHGEPAPAGWKSRPPTDKDADHGYPDKGGWLYRDPDNGAHYWYKNGVKHFMDVQEGTEGSWWSYPDEENFNRAAGSAMNPSKVVALRGDPSKYGIAHLRDSDEARENLAEMYLQHNKNIPPEALVEVPMRENVPGERNEHYMDTARRMGIPRGKHPMFDGPTRWSDKPLPFGPSRTGRRLEDVPDAELYRAEPMDIAFQLLKADDTYGCHHCYGIGVLPWGAPCKKCKGWGVPEEELEEIQSIQRDNPNWQDSIERSEPMDIAFQLLKSSRQMKLYNYIEDYPDKSPVTAYRGVPFLTGKPQDANQWYQKEGQPFDLDKKGTWWVEGNSPYEHEAASFFAEMPDIPKNWDGGEIPSRSGALVLGHRGALENLGTVQRRTSEYPQPTSEAFVTHSQPLDLDNVVISQPYSMKTGEPMNISFQLLKERKSPEAWANKKRYDSEYQKTPKRVKYREQLNAERRKRGIYGKGGKDVSHTQGGKLTLENPSSNRARHFKGKGTLRRVKVR